jgi:hypothetical protein
MPFVIAQALLEKVGLEGMLSELLMTFERWAYEIRVRPWTWGVLALVMILLLRKRR